MNRHFRALALPSGLIVVCLVLLIRDFRQESDAGVRTDLPMAVASGSDGDVKRRPDARLVWFDVPPGEKLFRKDSIRTANGSNAVIKLQGGGSVEVSENSLIVLEQSKGKVAIDFMKGNILSKGGGGGLILRTQGISINADSAQVNLTADKAKSGVAMNVVGGTATVESQGKTTEIKENQKSTLTVTGVGEVKEVPVKLLSPESSHWVIAQQGKTPIDFAWKNLTKVDNATLEIASDAGFHSIEKSLSLGSAESASQVQLQPGNHFWRVRSGKAEVSELRTLEVKAQEPIRLLEPDSKHPIRFLKQAPRIVFRWSLPDYLDKAEIQFATDPEFHDIVKKEPAPDGKQIALAPDFNQPVYWRISAASSRVQANGTSEGWRLDLHHLVALSPPTLVAPENKGVFRVKLPAIPVVFKWKPDTESSGYLIELAADEHFSKMIEKHELGGASYSWEGKEPGTYYWRVSAYDFDHELVQSKEIRSFTFELPPPVAIVVPSPTPSPTPSPKPSPTIAVAVAKPSPSPTPQVAEVTKNEEDTTEPDEASLEDETVENETASDAPIPLTPELELAAMTPEIVPPPTALLPPALIYPLGAKDTPMDKRMEFHWKRVEGAVRYHVRIWKDSQVDRRPAAEPIEGEKNLTTTDNSIVVSDLGDGVYRWEVQAYSASGPEAAESTARFELQAASEQEIKKASFSLSTAYAPYTYSASSRAFGVSENPQATAVTVNANGDYRINNRWSLGLNFRDGAYNLPGSPPFDLKEFDLQATARFPLFNSDGRWTALISGGIKAQDTYETLPASGFLFPNKVMSFGPTLGIAIKRQISERLSLKLGLDYSLPAFLGGALPGSYVTLDDWKGNFKLGLEGTYWVSEHWGFLLETRYESQGLSYVVIPNLGLPSEQIYLYGAYVYAGVSFRL